MANLRTLGLGVAFLATLVFVWWIDSEPRWRPTPDRTRETAAARRARLDALLDTEVRLDARDERLDELIARVCQSAGVRVNLETAPPAPGLDARITLELPEPVRLRSALALVAPEKAWGFVGDELRLLRQAESAPLQALRVRPTPAAHRDLGKISLDDAVTGPTRPLDVPSAFPSRASEPDLWEPSRFHLPGTARQFVSLDPETRDELGDLLAALEGIAAGQIDRPVRIGETAAGRAHRERLEAALTQPIELEFHGQDINTSLDSIQSQLGINLYFDRASFDPLPLDSEQQQVDFRGRMPAAAALRFLLQGFVQDVSLIGHDVVGITEHAIAQRRLSLRVYPTGHLFPAGGRWNIGRLLEVIRRLAQPAHNAWEGPQHLLAVDPSALIAYQPEEVHVEIEQILALLERVRNPARIVAGQDPTPVAAVPEMYQVLIQPAQAIPGPLTLEELAAHLASGWGVCAYVDTRALQVEGLASLVHPTAHERWVQQRVVLAGDSGAGTRADQLERLLTPVGCNYRIAAGVVIITSISACERDVTLEFHATPEGRPDPFTALNWGDYRDDDPQFLTIEAVVCAVLRGSALSKNLATVPGGILLRAPHSLHALLRRLLAPGHPFRETLAGAVQASPTRQPPVVDRALASDDPYVVALGAWVARGRARQHLAPLLQAFRSGALVRPEADAMAEAAADLWATLVDYQTPPAELAAALREVGPRASLELPFMEVLALACRHPDVEVCRAAFELVATLPERVQREGGHCYIDDQAFVTALYRPELASVVGPAVEAHARYWAGGFGSPMALHFLFEVGPHAPVIHDVFKPCLVRAPLIDKPDDWRHYPAWIGDVYDEMLEDDQPEHRQAACRALLLMPKPSPELRERLLLQQYDPATAPIIEAGVAAWREAGVIE